MTQIRFDIPPATGPQFCVDMIALLAPIVAELLGDAKTAHIARLDKVAADPETPEVRRRAAHTLAALLDPGRLDQSSP